MKQLCILIISSLVTLNVFSSEKPERILLTVLKPIHIDGQIGSNVQTLNVEKSGMQCLFTNFESYPIDIKANTKIIMYASEYDYRISWITNLKGPNIMGLECAMAGHDEVYDGYPANFISMFNSKMKGLFSIVQWPKK